MTIIKNECSECHTPYALDTQWLTVTVKVPSNGVRGKGHVPAHKVHADAVYLHDGMLIGWDCPVPGCGYAESEYASAKDRKVWT